MEWNGMEWNGMEWNGMEWNGMEWNGMEWNGMEWNGTIVGFVVKIRSNNLLSLVEPMWTCFSWAIYVMSMRDCKVARSGLQVSGQLKYPQRICFCFGFIVIFVRNLVSYCMVSLHRYRSRKSLLVCLLFLNYMLPTKVHSHYLILVG